MKNKVNLWLLIGGGLILFGGIIFVITMSFLDWDFKKLSTVEYETNEYEINEAFKNISIDTSTTDIILLPSEDGKAKVVAYEEEKINHTAKVEDGTLKIEITDSRNWYEKLRLFNFDSSKLTVYLPKASYESLKIDSSTGDICVDGAFYAEMNIKASTGDIELLDAACIGKISIEVSTGDISASTVTCNEFTATGSSGDITLDNVIATSKMQIKTGTGDISLDRCDSYDINLKTTTGDIEGSLLTGKIFDADASTGDVSVPPNVTDGGICKIRTSTGDIDIAIG